MGDNVGTNPRFERFILSNYLKSRANLTIELRSKLAKTFESSHSSKFELKSNWKMHFCAHNLRIGIFGDKTIIKAEKNVLSGPMGQLFEQLIFSKIQR